MERHITDLLWTFRLVISFLYFKEGYCILKITFIFPKSPCTWSIHCWTKFFRYFNVLLFHFCLEKKRDRTGTSFPNENEKNSPKITSIKAQLFILDFDFLLQQNFNQSSIKSNRSRWIFFFFFSLWAVSMVFSHLNRNLSDSLSANWGSFLLRKIQIKLKWCKSKLMKKGLYSFYPYEN